MNWSQLRTVLWLRWRLTRNQWSRRGGRLSAILTLLAIVAGLTIPMGGGVAGSIAGATGLSKAPPLVRALSRCCIWTRSFGAFLLHLGDPRRARGKFNAPKPSTLGRLLHLPVSLKGFSR